MLQQPKQSHTISLPLYHTGQGNHTNPQIQGEGTQTLPLKARNAAEFGALILKLSPAIRTQLKFGAIKSRRQALQVALVVKNPPANTGDVRGTGLIPGLQRSPGEGLGNPFQYSCLENPMHRRAWQATVHEVAKSQTRLSVTNAFTFTLRPDFKFNNGTKRKRPPHYFNLVNYCPSPHTMFFITSCLFISYTFLYFLYFFLVLPSPTPLQKLLLC